MSKTMRAVRFHGNRDIRVDDIPSPNCNDDQVEIRPAFVGICGTDLHEYLGGPTFCPVTPHAITQEVIPVTLGHEFSGTVTHIGKNAIAGGAPKDLEVGQHVAIQPTIACHTCPACKLSLSNVCEHAGFIGLSGGGGGLAASVCVPGMRVLRLPSSIPLDVGALVEPLAVGWHAVVTSPVKAGDNVLVLGGGPIGLAVLQALKALGGDRKVGKVLVSEVAKKRQEFAHEFGADDVLNPRIDDVEAKCQALFKDRGGVDVVFDCAGVAAGLETACKAIRARGAVVNVAIWEGKIQFNPNWLVFKEGKYSAVLGYVKSDFEDVIKAIDEGRLKPTGMITKKIAMTEIVEEGFRELVENKEEHVKILVDVSRE